MVGKIGIYPGTFDPITFGHLDIVTRSLKVVDILYIAVAESSVKTCLFSVAERLDLIRDALGSMKDIDQSRIEVSSFSGLLVKYAKEIDASIIIRGIRAVSDFEYEFQLSCMNSKLDPQFQTIFLPASEHLQLISSKIVKEVAKLGGDTASFVTQYTKQRLEKAFAK
jgi:pantetheine-phosphate adenylyltransferase